MLIFHMHHIMFLSRMPTAFEHYDKDSVDIDSLTEGADEGLLISVFRNAEHVSSDFIFL